MNLGMRLFYEPSWFGVVGKQRMILINAIDYSGVEPGEKSSLDPPFSPGPHCSYKN